MLIGGKKTLLVMVSLIFCVVSYFSVFLYRVTQRFMSSNVREIDVNYLRSCLSGGFQVCDGSSEMMRAMQYSLVSADKILLLIVSIAAGWIIVYLFGARNQGGNKLDSKIKINLMCVCVTLLFALSIVSQYLSVVSKKIAWHYMADMWQLKGMDTIERKCMTEEGGVSCHALREWLYNVDIGADLITSADDVVVLVLSIALSFLVVCVFRKSLRLS